MLNLKLSILMRLKNIGLFLNQSFYNKSTLKEIVNHKINQSYVYSEDTNRYEQYDIENDVRFYYEYGSISNRLVYNYIIKDITVSSTSFTLGKDDYFFNMYYSYLKNKDTLVEDKILNYDIGIKFAKYYKLSYAEEHDLLTHEIKKKELIFDMDEKCWGINLRVVDSIVASDTISDDDSYRQKILYLEFNLKQLFLFEQEYELEERNKNNED